MTLTIQQVIDTILAAIPGEPEADTVDTFKSGDPSQPVKGVVTTFMANLEVIEKAIAAGANLIITHEPTYYTHRDETDWLAEDALFRKKHRLIEESGIAIWRFHDNWHRHQPDGILTGTVARLGWGAYQDLKEPWFFNIPPASLREIARHFRDSLGASGLRYVGPDELVCSRVAILPGAIWETWQIGALHKADAVAVGEASEWSVPEYVRDAELAGLPKGLILLGHVASEEPGMAYLVDWLKEKIPGLPVQHIPCGIPLIKTL
jgi:putative NIF3 family GTP cyclohydrolase 1 type 2